MIHLEEIRIYSRVKNQSKVKKQFETRFIDNRITVMELIILHLHLFRPSRNSTRWRPLRCASRIRTRNVAKYAMFVSCVKGTKR